MHIVPGSHCTEGQRAAVAELLIAENGHEYPDWTCAEAALETALPGPIPITFVAIEDGVALGCASLLDDDEVSGWSEQLWLGNVVVTPSARGRGIGAALVGAVEAHARSIGITELHLVTTSAVDWYRSKGWVVVGQAAVHSHPMTVMHTTLL